MFKPKQIAARHTHSSRNIQIQNGALHEISTRARFFFTRKPVDRARTLNWSPRYTSNTGTAGEHDQARIGAQGERVQDAFQADGEHLQLPEILQNSGRRGALAVRGAVP